MKRVEKMKKSKKKIITKIVISLLCIIIFLFLAYLLFKKLGLIGLTKEQLQEKIASYGAWGPIAFIILSFLQVTFIPLPSAITIIAGNYLFGFFLSFLYSFIGIMLGAILAFFLGRKIGRPFINWIFGDQETVDYYLKKLHGKETIILFFMFLLPLFPDDALCAIAGILPIRFFIFFMMQFITRIISILATLIFMSGEIIPYHGYGIIILIIIGILAIIAFIVAYKNAERINDALITFTNKIYMRSCRKKEKKANYKN